MKNGQSIKRVDFSLQHHFQHGHVADSAEREKIHRNILELYISLCIGSVEDRAERDKAIEKKKRTPVSALARTWPCRSQCRKFLHWPEHGHADGNAKGKKMTRKQKR